MQGLSDPILVDSAIYIDRLRAGHDIRQELMPWLANGLLFNCGIVRGEVIRGFKNARLKAEMNAFSTSSRRSPPPPECGSKSLNWHGHLTAPPAVIVR
jgi:hypothetical protein